MNPLTTILISVLLASAIHARDVVLPYAEFKAELPGEEYHPGDELTVTISIACSPGFVCSATRVFCYKANSPAAFFEQTSLKISEQNDSRYISAEILPWKWERQPSSEMTIVRIISTGNWPEGDYLFSVQAVFRDEAKREYYRSIGFTFNLQDR